MGTLGDYIYFQSLIPKNHKAFYMKKRRAINNKNGNMKSNKRKSGKNLMKNGDLIMKKLNELWKNIGNQTQILKIKKIQWL